MTCVVGLWLCVEWEEGKGENWVNEAQCIHHTFSTLIKRLVLDAE